MIDRDTLLCPACRGSLDFEESIIRCTSCNKEYPLHGDVPIFVPDVQTHAVASHQHKKSTLRKVLKVFRAPHHSVYFNTLTPSYGEGKELKTFLQQHKDLKVLNIGSLSGNLSELHPHIINLDISYYTSVDIVADAHELPFKDGSIEVILFKNVLEHIRNPTKVMAEIERVLKPGGYLYIKLPFLQPFHAVPDDYQRYTQSGMKELLKEYKELAFGISVGPASMLSWMLREYLAILTSFGNYKLYEIGLIGWGWLTFWIKYTDILFRHNKLANRVVSAFYGIYQKK